MTQLDGKLSNSKHQQHHKISLSVRDNLLKCIISLGNSQLIMVVMTLWNSQLCQIGELTEKISGMPLGLPEIKLKLKFHAGIHSLNINSTFLPTLKPVKVNTVKFLVLPPLTTVMKQHKTVTSQASSVTTVKNSMNSHTVGSVMKLVKTYITLNGMHHTTHMASGVLQ